MSSTIHNPVVRRLPLPIEVLLEIDTFLRCISFSDRVRHFERLWQPPVPVDLYDADDDEYCFQLSSKLRIRVDIQIPFLFVHSDSSSDGGKAVYLYYIWDFRGTRRNNRTLVFNEIFSQVDGHVTVDRYHASRYSTTTSSA